MIRRAILLGACAALSACVTPGARAPVRSVSYETGPCFGACPVYRVTVDQSGAGTFEGRRFTAVTGERTFRISRGQYLRFVRRLEPLRPATGSVRYSGEACQSMATDLPSAEVNWHDDVGAQSLYFYFGCDMERNRAIAERLRAAPGLLPIGDYIRPAR